MTSTVPTPQAAEAWESCFYPAKGSPQGCPQPAAPHCSAEPSQPWGGFPKLCPCWPAPPLSSVPAISSVQLSTAGISPLCVSARSPPSLSSWGFPVCSLPILHPARRPLCEGSIITWVSGDTLRGRALKRALNQQQAPGVGGDVTSRLLGPQWLI